MVMWTELNPPVVVRPRHGAYELIADAHKLGDERPLILAGGAKAIYEPWDFFDIEKDGQKYSADVACTGEEFVESSSTSID